MEEIILVSLYQSTSVCASAEEINAFMDVVTHSMSSLSLLLSFILMQTNTPVHRGEV